jgi:hypothetical protein
MMDPYIFTCDLQRKMEQYKHCPAIWAQEVHVAIGLIWRLAREAGYPDPTKLTPKPEDRGPELPFPEPPIVRQRIRPEAFAGFFSQDTKP